MQKMAFVFKLVCCFNCSFLLLLRGQGMFWAGEVALGHPTAGFQVFCQRRRKEPDSLNRTCYSYFALTMCLRFPALVEERGDSCGVD